MDTEEAFTFRPSRVEGLNDVERVSVFPDRLELIGGGGRRTVLFRDIAKPQEPRWLCTIKKLFGRVPWPGLVADRDWFHEPADRFFVFYTDPKIKIYMPENEMEEYSVSHFFRVQQVIRAAGYDTFDLG